MVRGRRSLLAMRGAWQHMCGDMREGTESERDERAPHRESAVERDEREDSARRKDRAWDRASAIDKCKGLHSSACMCMRGSG